MILLSLLYGGIVGFCLGLTGGGGSIFAVPLLVYGLSVSAHDAVGISLASVGATAAVGAVQRMRHGRVEIRTGFVVACAGVIGAPIGTWIGADLSDRTRLLLFSLVMVVIASRMFGQAKTPRAQAIPLGRSHDAEPDLGGIEAVCRREPDSGRLRLSSRCAVMMGLVGVGVGMLAGLFGVGGGFIIVPALVFFARMEIARAMATSLLVIAVTSASGVASHLVAGEDLDFGIAALFVMGGLVGLVGGTAASARLSGPRLLRLFGVVVLGVAAWIFLQAVSGR